MTIRIDDQDSEVLAGRKVAFLGRLGGVTRREAQQIVRQRGGTPVAVDSEGADLIVIGADELPLGEPLEALRESTRQRIAQNGLEVMSETRFWQLLGLAESDQQVRRLYTPAMLAELLNVKVGTIRRWHRRGLIVPAREVHRLPYFDFQEVSTARHLAQLLAAGASPKAIERQLEDLARYVPDVDRPLAQLSVIVEGKQILMRQGEGLIEPGGQLRIDFDAIQRETPLGFDMAVTTESSTEGPASIAIPDRPATPAEILACANDMEDEGRLEEAVDMYRAALAAGGPRPEVCFQLAELLYRLGDVSAARERYYMVIELDEEYVEARANLGCVLAEQGSLELAVAAFEGALQCHGEYPDVHYHLARVLDESGREEEAEHHWRAFLRLTPDGNPWADFARSRLSSPV